MVRVELHGMSDETQCEMRDDGEDISDNDSPAGLVPSGEDAGVGMMEVRLAKVGDKTWMVPDCRYCPMKRRVKCSLTRKVVPTDDTVPEWCPLEKIQVTRLTD